MKAHKKTQWVAQKQIVVAFPIIDTVLLLMQAKMMKMEFSTKKGKMADICAI